MELSVSQLRRGALALARSGMGASSSGRAFAAVRQFPNVRGAANSAAAAAERVTPQQAPQEHRFFDRTNADAAIAGSFASGGSEARRIRDAAPKAAPAADNSSVLTSQLHQSYMEAIQNSAGLPREGPRQQLYHAETESITYSTLDAIGSVDQLFVDTEQVISEQDAHAKKKWHQQVQNEIRSVQEAMDRYNWVRKAALSRRDTASIPQGKKLMATWFPALEEAIKHEQYELTQGAKKPKTFKSLKRIFSPDDYKLYLTAIPADKLAVITMHAVMSELISKTGQGLLSKVAMAVGRAVQMQNNLEELERSVQGHNKKIRMRKRSMAVAEGEIIRLMQEAGMSTDSVKEAFENVELSGEAAAKIQRNKWANLDKLTVKDINMGINASHAKEAMEAHAEMGDRRERTWPSAAVAKLGAVLVACLLRSAKVEVPAAAADPNAKRKRGRPKKLQQQPAFFHSIEWSNPNKTVRFKTNIRRYGIISAHPAVFEALVEGMSVRDITVTRYFPMVVPPLPWIGYDSGGHLTLRCFVMRTRGDKAQLKLLKEADKEMAEGKPGMGQVYEALSALGSVGWQINKGIHDVVEVAWQMGGGLADLPEQGVLPDVPRPKNRYRLVCQDGQLVCEFAGPSFYEERDWRNEAAKVKKKNYERHSLKCDMEYKLQVARETRDEPVIYFPHNVDFRGRAYPMHPYLSHLGSDVCRAMLQFSEAKPLGEKGLEWLCIQAANLYGANKMSLDNRKQFILDNMDKVRDSAANPLDGERWWAEADEPWQCLAVCMEIVRAMDGGDPANHISHLPVHQDGSCNGLQHYAALGRDSIGGRAVNLTDVDKPQDVYSGIAELVAAQVEEDSANGVMAAELLRGNVDRKLVKQTVMTSVYGVTFVGAREQIANRLRERDWEDEKMVYQASKYGARVTMDKLHEMFESAKNIMGWLNNCAKLVAAKDNAMEWKTPLGLPVVQPYRKNDTTIVKTVLQRLCLKANNDDTKVMKQRQRTAFPPNYIHSIDSTHMMMTAIECRKRGLSFAGVHDSFWTHAGTIHTMNEVLREKFLELHAQPLLHDLLRQLEERFPDVDLPPVPEPGDLKLDEVHRAKYFFS